MRGAAARGAFATIATIATKPRLWPVAVTTLGSMVSTNWWRRAPFLPVPDRRWLRFRMVTAYGGNGRSAMRPDDVITYLEWRRTFPR